MAKLRVIISIVVVLLSGSPAAWAARAWESVDRMPGQSLEQVAEESTADLVSVAGGYVYVAVRQRSDVKLFTILGQLVVQDTLSPGIYRYKLSTRGIYLLKLGAVTRRVTV